MELGDRVGPSSRLSSPAADVRGSGALSNADTQWPLSAAGGSCELHGNPPRRKILSGGQDAGQDAVQDAVQDAGQDAGQDAVRCVAERSFPCAPSLSVCARGSHASLPCTEAFLLAHRREDPGSAGAVSGDGVVLDIPGRQVCTSMGCGHSVLLIPSLAGRGPDTPQLLWCLHSQWGQPQKQPPAFPVGRSGSCF